VLEVLGEKLLSMVPSVFILFNPNDPPTRSLPDESKVKSLESKARSVTVPLKVEPKVVVSTPLLLSTRNLPMFVFVPPIATRPVLLTAMLDGAPVRVGGVNDGSIAPAVVRRFIYPGKLPTT
jgi:hypothetical protein